MKQLAAAIPLAIALTGSIQDPDDGRQLHFRIAPNADTSLHNTALNADQTAWFEEHNTYGMPINESVGNRTLIVRKGYTLAHNNVDKIADWVSFHLTKDYVNGVEKRPGSSAFKAESMIQQGLRAEKSDYAGWLGVYDRGHQAAAGDTKGRGKQVIKDSFYLSNMTPQSASLNRGQWKSLEGRVQSWAKRFQEVWVVTGPIFLDQNGNGIVEYYTIGDNSVAVPTHYFKAVLAPIGNDKFDAIAFIIPNEKVSRYGDFISSIDEIEKSTQLDLFPGLPDDIEKSLEAKVANRVWPK